MVDYQEFLDSIDRKAYHEGEWQWEEDGYTVTRTYNYTGPGCHDSCGVLLYTKDGKLERIEGDPLDPYANGKLCMRCLDIKEMVESPTRVKYPMKRDPKFRGDATKWERISWDEALDMIETYIKEEIDGKGLGRDAIIVNHGTGRNINWQVPFIAGACLRTANVGGVYFSGWWCYMPRVCGAAGPLGDYPLVDASETLPDRYANKEWVRPDVLVIWGVEPNKSNADGYLGHWLNLCVQMGSKIISIDPVLTWWGARAEYWLRPHPGTDCCIALAWLNVICNEDLIDHQFVDYWCAYYDELKEHVQQFSPEWASAITGVPVEDIIGFHVGFERIHPFQDGNGRVGRLIMFKECLASGVVPFIIADDMKAFYYQGLSEWDCEKGFLTDTCLAAQDRFKEELDYFRIPYGRGER